MSKYTNNTTAIKQARMEEVVNFDYIAEIMPHTQKNRINELISDYNRNRVSFEELRSGVKECCDSVGIDFYDLSS
jgi:hypothetical protein